MAILVLTTATLGLADKRLTPAIRTYAAQSLLLGLLVTVEGWTSRQAPIVAFGIIIFLVKGVATPVYVQWLSRRVRTGRELEPLLNIPLSLLAAGLCLFAAVMVSQGMPVENPTDRVAITAGFATFLLGLLTMATRRKAILQALGLLTIENGTFLLGLVLTGGLPIAVELAILLDVLVLVVLLGMLFQRIRDAFDHLDVSQMRTLGE